MSATEWPAPTTSEDGNVTVAADRHIGRRIAAIVSLLFTLIMLATTLTVPAIAATGPAILTVACGVLTWAVWPKKG